MTYDIVIAGGGPVGLFLACELQLAGVSVVVLERMEDPHSPLKAGWMGMRGLNFPSVAAFYRRGLLDAVRASALGWMDSGERQATGSATEEKPVAAKSSSTPPPPRFAGHFAGIMLDASKIDLSVQKFVLPGPSAAGGLVSLEGVELLLAERAQELGAKIVRGAAVTDFVETASGVTALTENGSFAAQWLVGCDGGRSTVRKLAGFEFAGTDPELTGYTAWVEMADSEKLKPGFNLTPAGMYINGPGPGRIGVVEFDGASFDRTASIALESLQAILRHVSGTDVTITTLHAASSYTDRARQATTYRKGRVLLAGDAAHVHSPFGGQGLNTGLGDAMNLGWKLAATVNGWAPDGLLDTYTAERHPVGAWALDWTRAQVAIMRPDPYAHAIASVIRDLMNTREGTMYFVEKVSGIALRYNLPGEHPLIGRSAPDFEFEDGSRLGEFLHEGRGLLLDFSESRERNALCRKWSERVSYMPARTKDTLGVAALLIRPDGFVAWATESGQDVASLQQTLQHWFGDPSIS